MRLGDFLAHLGRPAAYYPSLVRACGGVQAGLLLCQLAYWHGKQRDPDGWIRKSAAELEEETGLTTREQQTGRTHLRNRGILEESLRGVPATLEYRLKFDALDFTWAAASLAIPLNQFGDSAKLVSTNRQTITETTTETTSENKAFPLAPLADRALGFAQDQQQDLSTAPRLSADATSKRQTTADLKTAFAIFWGAYPPRHGRRDRKAESLAAYLKLAPDPALQDLMVEAVLVYGMGNELPVDACRWIKGRRWEDETIVRVTRRPKLPPSTAAKIPDEKPIRTSEAIARVKGLVDSLPFMRNRTDA